MRVEIVDSGGALGVDLLLVHGTNGADDIRLNAAGSGAFRVGFVESFDRDSGRLSTFVSFRDIERLNVFTLGGADRVLSDDTAVVTVVDLGGGDDEITVGTVPLIPDKGNRTLEFPEGVPVADTQNMTNGNSADLFVLGDGQNDRFEVNHNRGKLWLHGGAGDDRFLLKTFLVLKENPDNPNDVTNLMQLFGGSGNNRYDYLENAPVFINGGPGTDTIVIVGTPIGDLFIVTDTYAAGAGRIVSFTAIERLEIDGGGGNDTIYVLSTGDAFETIITGGSGDDTIHIGGDHPTLVIDQPPFTYTPPPFKVSLPPVLVYDTTELNLDGGTFTIDLFDWLSLGGTALSVIELLFGQSDSSAAAQAAGELLAERYVSVLQTVASLFGTNADYSLVSVANVSARAKYSFFNFLFNPKIEVTLGTFRIEKRIGRLVARTALIQPPDVTVDPPPIAVKEPRSLDASQIRGRLTIIGGDQFEDAGDRVIFHNQEGAGGDGKLVERRVPRLVQVGVRNGAPVFAPDIDPDTGLPVPDDVYVSLEGAGLGIDDVAGQLSSDGVNRYYGVEIRGIEGLELRLSDLADTFTVNHTPAGMALHVWAGGGADDVLVEGIGGATTISGGDGDDDIRAGGVLDGVDNDGDTLVDEADELDLASILGRLTVDGRDELAESSEQVRDNDADPLVATYLTRDLVIISAGPAVALPGSTTGQVYYQADFVPILVDPTPGTAGTPIQVRSVVVDSGGVVVERLVQELGSLEQARQKLNASLVALWFDKEGREVTDASITGVPVLVPTSATGAVGPVRDVYVDATFNKVFEAQGPTLVKNGTLGQFVATNGTAGDWTTQEIAGGGGWSGGTFVLDSDADVDTEPTMFQQLGGLSPNVTYRVEFSFRNWGAPYGDNTADTLRVEVGTTLVDCATGAAGGTYLGRKKSDAPESGSMVTAAFCFKAASDSHTLRFTAEVGSDVGYRIDNVSVRAQHVRSVATNFAGGTPVYVDPAGRRTLTVTGKPSVIPINHTEPRAFSRVHDSITSAATGSDRLFVAATLPPSVLVNGGFDDTVASNGSRRRLDERDRRRGRRLEGRRDVRPELRRLAVERPDAGPGAHGPRRRPALPRQRQLPQLRRRLRRRHAGHVRRLRRRARGSSRRARTTRPRAAPSSVSPSSSRRRPSSRR